MFVHRPLLVPTIAATYNKREREITMQPTVHYVTYLNDQPDEQQTLTSMHHESQRKVIPIGSFAMAWLVIPCIAQLRSPSCTGRVAGPVHPPALLCAAVPLSS